HARGRDRCGFVGPSLHSMERGCSRLRRLPRDYGAVGEALSPDRTLDSHREIDVREPEILEFQRYRRAGALPPRPYPEVRLARDAVLAPDMTPENRRLRQGAA